MASTPSRNLSFSSARAPPPSPIPTAKGSRSAADPVFSEYVDRSQHVPELNLPEHIPRALPANLDYRSISSGDDRTKQHLLRSAAEVGIFQVKGHGISTQGLQSVLEKNEHVFGISNTDHRRQCTDSEKLVIRWPWDAGTLEIYRNSMGLEDFHVFRDITEDIGRKLQIIAEDLACLITSQITVGRYDLHQNKESNASRFIVHRCRHAVFSEKMLAATSSREKAEFHPHHDDLHLKPALILHLPLDQPAGELLLVRSGVGDHLLLRTSPDTILVLLGAQLEEWSRGRLKSAAIEESIGESDQPHRRQTTFSVELRWASSCFSRPYSTKTSTTKIVTVNDQLLILVVFLLLFKVFASVFS